MDSASSAALTSWTISPLPLTLLLVIAAVYVSGWLRVRRRVRGEHDTERLTSFLAGLALVFLATESPLDAFDHFFLAAHMTQHLLLMMFAPPLVLFARPTVPLLRGLPKTVVKEWLGPFLMWPALKRFFQWLVAPPVAWVVFAASTIFWHLPWAYEAALSSTFVHGLQHASFFWTGIIFWWPVIRPIPGKSRWPDWALIPYLLASDVVNTGISIIFVFSGRILYPSYELVRASSLSAQNDQKIAGLIMWVPGSVVYLIPAFFLAMRMVTSPKHRAPAERIVRVASRPPKVGGPSILPKLRRPAQVVMLLIAIAVVSDGFFGKQVAPLNLAGVLPWIHWRFLAVLALLVLGNMFCMACPFTLVRDIGRRVLPANRRWPSFLRTKWVAAALLVTYLWAYEALGLWNSPFRTAWIIVGYFGAALLVDGFFRGASFCKYVCPIGQFHFVNSLISPREVRIREPQVCKSCSTHDCIRGNDERTGRLVSVVRGANKKTRGCELYLFQPKKESNLDCTFCLDCVKACPANNVALLPVLPAASIAKDPYRSSIGRLSRRTDWAALALVIVFGAFVNAALMTGPVMMWEHGWHARLGPGAMPWIEAAVVACGLILVPIIVSLLWRVFGSKELMHRFAFALVPLGFTMWLAHVSFHFVSALAAGASMDWLTSIQMLMLDCGLLVTLYAGWQIAAQYSGRARSFAALASVACGLYAAGLWILFQPMQMRGVM